MVNRDELLEKTQQAVQAREAGNLEESHNLFESILAEVDTLKDSSDEEDKNAYVGIMAQWIIQMRHEGKAKLAEAVNVSKSVANYSKLQNLRPPYSAYAARGVSHVLLDLGEYEIAEKYLQEMVHLIPDEDISMKGDAQAHLAKCLFRQDKQEEAVKLIEEALQHIDQKAGTINDTSYAAWKSGALMIKALILGKENKESVELVKEALILAEDQNLSVRIQEAKRLLEYFQ